MFFSSSILVHASSLQLRKLTLSSVPPVAEILHSIYGSSPSRIRQDLISLLNPDKLFRILLDPTRRARIWMVLPGQLLVRLLDFRHGSGFGYAQKLLEGELLVLHHQPIVDCGLRLGSERPGPVPEGENRFGKRKQGFGLSMGMLVGMVAWDVGMWKQNSLPVPEIANR